MQPDVCIAVVVCMATFVPLPLFPMIAFAFPCHHFGASSVITYFYPRACSTLTFQLASYLLEFYLIFAPAIVLGMEAILFATFIQTLNQTLSILVHLSKRVKDCDKTKRCRILLLYRKCQVLTIYINTLSQMCILPQGQTGACMFIISGLYTILVSGGKIPNVLYFANGIMIVSAALFVFLLLDVSGKAVYVSKRLLVCLKKWPLLRKDGELTFSHC